jgi:hypothetical protein
MGWLFTRLLLGEFMADADRKVAAAHFLEEADDAEVEVTTKERGSCGAGHASSWNRPAACPRHTR